LLVDDRETNSDFASSEALIERYNRAGDAARAEGGPVHWPHIALDARNLERLVEGVLGVRMDFVRAAFGDDFDADARADRVEEAWRTDALQTRYAPEGVFVRARFTVRVTLAEEADEAEKSEGSFGDETLEIAAEICLSFVERRHTRPFVDFMSGELRRLSDGTVKKLDPFAFAIEPSDALAWGLNGASAG
jgi:hypothetical protein